MEKQNNAKFAFYYLLSLVVLAFTAVSTGIIIFQIINKKIIDLLDSTGGNFDSGALRFAISAIIIAAPIYFTLAYCINKNLNIGELSKESSIRKWLTYFIMFVASVVMIGWLIAALNSFFNGELTIRFILKATSAILIAAIIFSFYLYDIKREETKKENYILKIFYLGSIIIVAAALIAGFFHIESPNLIRARKYDNTLMEKFSQIDNAINIYFSDHKQLPDGLSALVEAGLINNEVISDSLSKKIFDYKIQDKNSYELCAEFKTSNKTKENNYGYLDSIWPHDSGYQCLNKKVGEFNYNMKAPPPIPKVAPRNTR